ncbi:MAG: glycosyltransferase family 39 protein [Isosphaeraceae bacterium]
MARAWPLGIVVATLTLMVATEPYLAIVWDEGYTLGRESRIKGWFQALRDPGRFAATWQPPTIDLVQPDRLTQPPLRAEEVNTRAKLFEPRALAWFWPFAREEPHGHPPFYAIVGVLGDVLTPGSWPPLARARFGPMLAFSLTAGALFGFANRRWGFWPALLGAGAWVLQPRLFGHGHYATYDALLTSLWVGTILAFARAVEPKLTPSDDPNPNPQWIWVVVFGVLVGWAADTKFTAWLLPVPFLAWTVLYRSRRGLQTLAVGALVGLVTLYAFNPAFWVDPVGGVDRFLRSSLSRGRTIPIPVLFLGQVVQTPNQSLPWYNTLVWTLFVTPVGLLIFAIFGMIRGIRRRKTEPFGVLVLIHWAFLLTLRALPHTPGHDGVRQFLPAFGCLALAATLGAVDVWERWGTWVKYAFLGVLVEAGLGVALMMPVPLSYYSPLVGGLPGATSLGMEPTYYWDALTDDALDWLNQNTPQGAKVRFSTFPTSWLYLRETGRLQPEVLPNRPGPIAWYVVQNRPGALLAEDRALLARGRPSYVVSKWGVPLVLIYPYNELGR